MKNKINLVEFLNDCPSGMELDCTMFDNVTLLSVDNTKGIIYPIKVLREDGFSLTLTKYGQCTNTNSAKCVIFPKGKTTWEGFLPPSKFKDGDIIFYNDTIAIFKEWGDETLCKTYVTTYLCYDSFIDLNIPLFGKSIRKEARFATEEEKKKLFKVIQDNGYKWNPETKTLDKLVPNKFDITTFKPFDKVLARCSTLDKWHIQFFEKYDKTCKYPFICMGYNKYKQCIPYEGNEYLLDTADNCDEFYEIW